MTKNKEPQRQFRGTWVPPEPFFLLEEGKIDRHKFALLLVVESYVKARGVGCWASNKTLGQKVGGMSVRRVQEHIEQLINDGYLIRREDPTGEYWRLLETCWSNTFPDQETHAKNRMLDKHTHAKNRVPPCEKSRPSSSPTGNCSERSKPPATRGGVFPGKPPLLNGKLHSPPKQADPAPEEIEKVVNELRRVSSEVHRVAPTGKRASWVAHLLAIERKLLDNGRSRLLGVLRWYCENAGTDKCPKPIITGVCHLTIGVFTFIEGRMKDAGKKTRRPDDDCDDDYTRRHLEEYLESQRELEQAGRAYRAGRNGR